MFEQNVTVFNKYKQNREELVVKNTLANVYFSTSKGVSISDTGMVKNSSATLIIPMGSRTNYVKPKDFIGTGWTIQNDDYVIEGNIEDEFDIKELSKLYEIYKVLSVSNNEFGELQNLRVECGQ